MIYTVTFNPSLDYVIRVKEFELGNLHRTQAEELFVGGKGINVSTVLKRLGISSVALGFTAGFTGNEIVQRLKEQGLNSDFISLNQGISRINVKLKTDNHTETELNGQGPDIDQVALEQLYNKMRILNSGDYLVLSGSVPKSLSNVDQIYSDICRNMKQSGIRVVIDAEGDLLKNSLCEQPFLIKPNLNELEKLFGQAFMNEEDIIDCARKLKAVGAVNVLVSLAGAGAVLVDEFGMVHRQVAPQGEVLNSVGAGDSMIAGFLTHLIHVTEVSKRSLQSQDYAEAMKLGIAAGSAGAFSSGLPEKEMIEAIYHQITGKFYMA